MRYIKVIAVVYVLGLHAFLLQNIFHTCTVPSFYYNLYYKNDTSHDFLLVKVVQLTDVAWGPGVLPNSHIILAKGKTGHITIPGEVDSLNTLFIVTAVPCTEKGRRLDIRSKSAFIDIFPFSSFRNNTFSSEDGSPPKQEISAITDNHFIPIDDIQKRFNPPL